MPKGIYFKGTLPTKEIIRLYTKERMPYDRISKQFHVSTPIIRKLLSDNGISINRSFIKTKVLDTNEIIRLYSVEHLPSTEIARRYGITNPTVLRRLHENNIPINPKHGSPYNKLRIKINELPPFMKNPEIVEQQLTAEVTCPICHKTRRLHIDRPRMNDIKTVNGRCNLCAMKARSKPIDADIVRKLYVTNKWTPNQIAEKYNLSSRRIRTFMEQHNIHTRPKGELRILQIKNKGTLDKPVIGDICRSTDLGLKWNYYLQWVSCAMCHKERWEQKTRVNKEPYCIDCAHKLWGLKYRGEKASAWRGGISFEPYTYDFKWIREKIRERDKYTCQLCGLPQNGKLLSVHHIDYDKKNTDPMNLISLCPCKPNSCHSKTNHNRSFYTEYFQLLMAERFPDAMPDPNKMSEQALDKSPSRC